MCSFENLHNNIIHILCSHNLWLVIDYHENITSTSGKDGHSETVKFKEVTVMTIFLNQNIYCYFKKNIYIENKYGRWLDVPIVEQLFNI